MLKLAVLTGDNYRYGDPTYRLAMHCYANLS